MDFFNVASSKQSFRLARKIKDLKRSYRFWAPALAPQAVFTSLSDEV
jgi:hypothetical protein